MKEGNKTVRIYLREIGEVDLLTREEEVSLAKRIARGDKDARQKMIRANLRLVVKIAQDYAHFGLPLLDLISEGNLGLMKAVDRFDPAKGGKVSTYAAWWIKQSIKRALANQSKTIRLPAHLVDKIFRMRRKKRELTYKLGREPKLAELARALNVPAKTVDYWNTVGIQPASLDAPIVGDRTEGKLGDIIGDETGLTPSEEMEDRQLLEEIEERLPLLESRERAILTHRFGLKGQTPETLEEVGRRFGITRERVRQIQNETLLRLREMLEETHPEAARPD